MFSVTDSPRRCQTSLLPCRGGICEPPTDVLWCIPQKRTISFSFMFFMVLFNQLDHHWWHHYHQHCWSWLSIDMMIWDDRRWYYVSKPFTYRSATGLTNFGPFLKSISSSNWSLDYVHWQNFSQSRKCHILYQTQVLGRKSWWMVGGLSSGL